MNVVVRTMVCLWLAFTLVCFRFQLKFIFGWDNTLKNNYMNIIETATLTGSLCKLGELMKRKISLLESYLSFCLQTAQVKGSFA